MESIVDLRACEAGNEKLRQEKDSKRETKKGN